MLIPTTYKDEPSFCNDAALDTRTLSLLAAERPSEQDAHATVHHRRR